jgi:RAC serine/threonine-protein kinase
MIEKDGYLTKEGANIKSWKRRYFMLKNGVLSYHKSPKDVDLGKIHMSDVSVVQNCDRKKKNFCFEIVTPSRIYYFQGDNDKDKESWMNALKLAKQEIKGELNRKSAEAGGDRSKLVSVDDFDLLATVGKGSFGKVIQVRKKDTGKIYAMKVLDKHHILEANEVEHTRSEKNILQMIHHPFLVNLYYAFQTETKLYFIMDFVNGGEMFYHLQKEKRFPQERVQFYGAEILLALEHLHNNGIIYRDLKPENLLLTAEGHVVVTDFGLSKEGIGKDGRTVTFCGTPEYLAPEILQGKAYGKAVDWWSFGSLLYEMLTGMPPFYSNDVEDMYRKILKAQVNFPRYFSDESKAIISELLEREPTKRLVEPEKIKQHIFFRGIDWQKLYLKQVKPPFIPDVKSIQDISQIDPEFTSEKPVLDDGNSAPISSSLQDQFADFAYQPQTTA